MTTQAIKILLTIRGKVYHESKIYYDSIMLYKDTEFKMLLEPLDEPNFITISSVVAAIAVDAPIVDLKNAKYQNIPKNYWPTIKNIKMR